MSMEEMGQGSDGVMEGQTGVSVSREHVTTELGMTVPVKPGEEYREHTVERWKERDPAGYAFALHLIRDLGIVNRSEIERQVSRHREERGLPGISRNSVIALLNSPQEFKPGEINEIIARQAALLTMESVGAARELVDKARSTKDLGAIAMTMTSAHNVKQLSSGGPSQVKMVVHKFDIEDFERMRLAEGRVREKVSDGVVVDVEAARRE